MRKLISVFFVLVLVSSPVFAALPGLDPVVKSDLVKVGGDIVVPPGAIVKSVVVVGGNAVVGGSVMEDVVAIGGDVDLKKGSSVAGNVSVIGGKVTRADGTAVKGSVTVMDAGALPILPATMTGRGLLWAGAAFKLISFVAMLALALFLTALLPLNIGRISYYSERLPGHAILWGLIMALLVVPIVIILGISVIGIVFIPLYLIVLFAGWFFGLIGISQLAGKKLLQGLKVYNKPMLIEVATGLLLIELIALIPVAGMIIKFVAALIGLGAVFATRFGVQD